MANRFQRTITVLLGFYISLVVAQGTQECSGQKADIIFMLDSSTSEGQVNFKHQLDFVKNLTTIYDIGPSNVQIGLASFSSHVHHQFWLNSYPNQASLQSAIDNVPYTSGNTNTGEGLNFVTTQGFTSAHGMRSDVQHILVVMTDGQSQDGPATAAMAVQAHQAGIEVMAIGIGSGVSMSELQAIASDSKHVLTVDSFLALASIQHTLAAATCNISKPAPPNACGSKPADIVFILDSSGSEGSDNFNKQLQFMTNFVKHFQVGPHDVQFGLVTFSYEAKNEFFLNTYNSQQAISDKLKHIVYIGSTTHTDLGLQYARQFQFSSTHGARNNAQKIAIVLTDGQSQSRTDTIHQADLLKQMGVKLISIGIGSGISHTELVSMATDQQHVFTVTNFDALHTIQSELKDSACGVGGGTTPASTSTTSVCIADVVFAIDASGAEGQSNFQKSLAFMSGIVNEFPGSPGNVQFGLVTFGAHASADFDLSQYHNKASLIRAIQSAPYIGGAQHSWVALHLVRTHTLTAARGARAGVNSYVILLTNGPSSSHSAFLREVTYLRQATNMTGIAIGIGNGVNAAEMNGFAADGHHSFRVSNADALSALKRTIHDSICGGTSPALTTPLPALTTTPIDYFQIFPDSSN